jgi:hypothetical protein
VKKELIAVQHIKNQYFASCPTENHVSANYLNVLFSIWQPQNPGSKWLNWNLKDRPSVDSISISFRIRFYPADVVQSRNEGDKEFA